MRSIGFTAIALVALVALVGCVPGTTIDFNNLSTITTAASAPVNVGDRFHVGDVLIETTSNTHLKVLPFRWSVANPSASCPTAPGWAADGYVEIVSTNKAGGSGNEIRFNNASLGVTNPAPGTVHELKVKAADAGGNINLLVNGHLHSDDDFAGVPSPIAPPPVYLAVTGPTNQSVVELTGEMKKFTYTFPCPAGFPVQEYWAAIGGGQELWMDDLWFKSTSP